MRAIRPCVARGIRLASTAENQSDALSTSNSGSSDSSREKPTKNSFIETSVIDLAFASSNRFRLLFQKRNIESTLSIPVSATTEEVHRAAYLRRLAKNPISKFIFKRLATVQVEASNAPEDGEGCSLRALGRMGWLCLFTRIDTVSSHPKVIRNHDSPDPRVNPSKTPEISNLGRIDICYGRLVPGWGRQEPTLYGPSNWHKYRWCWDDYDWISKLVVNVTIEETGNDTNNSLRYVRVKTDMRFAHTSHLPWVLLLPTWWLLARPLCGIIHRGVVHNVQKFAIGEEADEEEKAV
ncbi:hypothetical protein AAMO2058_001449700 [Amorphochlora amoebiformis]